MDGLYIYMEINQNENRLVELTFILNCNNLTILVPIIKKNIYLNFNNKLEFSMVNLSDTIDRSY